MSYEHRQATAALRVLDAAGQPVAGRTLRVDQTSHDFLFGSGAFDAIPYANDRQGDPFLRDRMEKWLRLFRAALSPWRASPRPRAA